MEYTMAQRNKPWHAPLDSIGRVMGHSLGYSIGEIFHGMETHVGPWGTPWKHFPRGISRGMPHGRSGHPMVDRMGSWYIHGLSHGTFNGQLLPLCIIHGMIHGVCHGSSHGKLRGKDHEATHGPSHEVPHDTPHGIGIIATVAWLMGGFGAWDVMGDIYTMRPPMQHTVG